MNPAAGPRLVVLLLCVGCAALAPGRTDGQPSTRVALAADGNRILIRSSGATRGELLELLRTKYRIEVRPYLQPDERVSIRVEDAPIDSAIALIMPTGSHYIVRFGEKDVARAASSNLVKRGSRERRSPGLRAKTNTRPILARGPRFKPAPMQVTEPSTPRGSALKGVADAGRTVPPGLGPKVARPRAGLPDSTLRINFSIRAPDSVRVTDARMIEGVTPASTIVRGPFVFVMRTSAGGILYYGTLIDPLEEHSYEDRANVHHTITRANEGSFGISIPATIARRLAGARIEFYDATEASLPATLEPATLNRILARSKRVGRVDGRTVIAASREGTHR